MNYIKKHGNANDKANLPEETRYNAPHRTRRKLKRKVTEITEEVTEMTEDEEIRQSTQQTALEDEIEITEV